MSLYYCQWSFVPPHPQRHEKNKYQPLDLFCAMIKNKRLELAVFQPNMKCTRNIYL